ncbi:bifunctional riboflavin kinase/FAD synthetase [Neoehrlichia mikurensis]|uniref:Riboflavin biosynthesis protein n=1 Tax=Neoehrlichia mikurensis TaxID=89586 RepID=A0A9Q9F3W0_9RICK|nr:bifunctional riboflavin kinase/FAD synthetase [Neoehrlichia mikurensis]QXK91637.1 bifunctional riboflavin kinase/FAD synthetase [Neoehrlichia mikurensis]QXK92848.1 bifunctional riboflavin kinase/FAD synthetase [Neoehrlichia mikurensis]QXK93328.1 bifunctional riboflavin kinase/FAD synthetase [Neoehrlichia mikurensis]UTO55730.1 bifunctional riboflavin kinase/FAD synthetase [Neoehrlichia mikurensis]UTO56647.1 bifunctional riboflavin kinase/FAD synthetase [Neoehrlichia mikurensis]
MKVLYGYHGNVDVVLAFGNFDGVHLGHGSIFSTVKNISQKENISSAILTFVPHTEIFLRNKKNFLLSNFEQKIKLIKQYGIDCLYVIEFNDAFSKILPEDFIIKVLVNGCKMKHIVVGHDCIFGHKGMGDMQLLRVYSQIYNYGITEINPLIKNGVLCSSSSIRKYLQSGDIKLANQILGRSYQVSGKIFKGLGRGQTLGFPTINIKMESFAVPKFGVYAARAKIYGYCDKWFDGIVNIGIRPTFCDIEYPVLEMYIFDFCDNIYAKEVSIELLGFIRSEKKFDTIDQLVSQIKCDIAKVKADYLL